jgi:hypothetical protein
MVDRERLPNRRLAEVFTFKHNTLRWTACVGRSASGQVTEIFLDAQRESPLAEMARELALVTSIALQYGAPLEVLKHALDSRDASPLSAALSLAESPEAPS